MDGHAHTRLMITIHDELLRQFPDAFFEDTDYDLVIPSGVTPQSAFVKLDTSTLAEAILRAAPASPTGDSDKGPGASVADSALTVHAASTETEGH